MPFSVFGGSASSPFDQSVESATSDKNQEDDWGLIMDICDRVSAHKDGPRDVIRSIFKRLNHRSSIVALKALTLLDACVSNCGRKFAAELSSKEVVQELKKITNNCSHSKVTEKIKSTVKKWADCDLKSESSITQLHNDLKAGIYSTVSFEPSESRHRSGSSKAKMTAQELQEKEIEDLARAMALSMQEAQHKPSGSTTTAQAVSSSGSNNTAALYPSYPTVQGVGNASAISAGNLSIASTASNSNEPRKVRALYDFEAAEENELTFKTGDIIFVLDDSDANWWRGFTAATPAFAQTEGLLFPSNFVTSDLTYDPVPENVKQTAVAAESTPDAAQPAAVDPTSVVIDEDKIDRGLALIQEADPTGEQRPDGEELLRIEQECQFMVPLVDTELEQVDALHAKLADANQALLDAFQEYHRVMSADSDKRQQMAAGMGMTMMPGASPYATGAVPPQYYDPSSAPNFIPQYSVPVSGNMAAAGAGPYAAPFPQMQQQQQSQQQPHNQDFQQPVGVQGQQQYPQPVPQNGYLPNVNGNPASTTTTYVHLQQQQLSTGQQPPQPLQQQQPMQQPTYTSYNSSNVQPSIPQQQSLVPPPPPQQYHQMPGQV